MTDGGIVESMPIILPPVKKYKFMARIKTIKLSGNVDYAKVSARVAEFHKAYKNGCITTQDEFKNEFVIFRATIVLDAEKPERKFTGTSLGKINGIKAFEKLETIAVGRALAFAGFLSDGEIASNEEMANYEETVIQIDNSAAINKLKATKSLTELKTAWLSLTQAERDDEDVAFTKEELKLGYERQKEEVKNEGV